MGWSELAPGSWVSTHSGWVLGVSALAGGASADWMPWPTILRHEGGDHARPSVLSPCVLPSWGGEDHAPSAVAPLDPDHTGPARRRGLGRLWRVQPRARLASGTMTADTLTLAWTAACGVAQQRTFRLVPGRVLATLTTAAVSYDGISLPLPSAPECVEDESAQCSGGDWSLTVETDGPVRFRTESRIWGPFGATPSVRIIPARPRQLLSATFTLSGTPR